MRNSFHYSNHFPTHGKRYSLIILITYCLKKDVFNKMHLNFVDIYLYG